MTWQHFNTTRLSPRSPCSALCLDWHAQHSRSLAAVLPPKYLDGLALEDALQHPLVLDVPLCARGSAQQAGEHVGQKLDLLRSQPLPGQHVADRQRKGVADWVAVLAQAARLGQGAVQHVARGPAQASSLPARPLKEQGLEPPVTSEVQMNVRVVLDPVSPAQGAQVRARWQTLQSSLKVRWRTGLCAT